MLVGAAVLLAVPVGFVLSWLRDRSEPAQLKRIADLTHETEEQRATIADYQTRLDRLGDELIKRTRRVSDAEREIGQLLAELKARIADLEASRTTIATLEGGVQASQVRVDDEVRQRHARAVGYIVHAIRSALTNVLGFSKLLLRGADGTLSDTQRADALNIHFAGKHLLTVVNDLVDLTQLENGTLKLKEELIEARGLLDDAAAAATLSGRSAGDVVIECPAALPLVKADRSRLVQILETVVEQAPDSGRITLQARSAQDTLEIIVTWPQPAATKTLDELCEPFPPANPVSPIQDGGRRLRLAVARRLALATGGTLAVQHGGAATTFTLTMPAAIDAMTVA
jgi:signal transduction histidine kinase